MDNTKTKQPYESPVVTDYGSIEDITKGQIAVNLDDFPIGAKVISPIPSLPIPLP